jgi:hypothetical protein
MAIGDNGVWSGTQPFWDAIFIYFILSLSQFVRAKTGNVWKNHGCLDSNFCFCNQQLMRIKLATNHC